MNEPPSTGSPTDPHPAEASGIRPADKPSPVVAHPMPLIRTRKRVADHGEVFTPAWMVTAMLDLVKGETDRLDSRVLEPACGSGNFLVEVLRRKLAAVEATYGKADFERRHYALLAVMCTYGIELLADNIAECRANMLEVLADYLDLEDTTDAYRAASNVLTLNLMGAAQLRRRSSRLLPEPCSFGICVA